MVSKEKVKTRKISSGKSLHNNYHPSLKLYFQVEIFQELARIFSEENNQWNLRDLMITEGTSKFAATVGENDKHLPKILQRQLNNGAVRFLFITHRTI